MTVPAGGGWRIEERCELPLATPPLRPSSSPDPFGTCGEFEVRRGMKETETGEEMHRRSAGVSFSHFSREKISMASGGRVRRRE
jgi:hypothetical protein